MNNMNVDDNTINPDFLELYIYLNSESNASGVIIVNKQYNDMLSLFSEYELEKDKLKEGLHYLHDKGYIEIGMNEDKFVADIIVYYDSELLEKQDENIDKSKFYDHDIEKNKPKQLNLFGE